MAWRLTAIAFGVVMTLAVVAGVARVTWLESREVRVAERATIEELSSREGATSESVRLARVELARDQIVTFELCADDPMREERWAGALALAVWRPRARELMTRSELTPEVLAQVRRDATHGCLLFGRGVIAEDDVYAVEALFHARPEALARVPLTIIIQARQPLETIDLVLVVIAWLSALGLVLALALRRPEEHAPSPSTDAKRAMSEEEHAAPRATPELGSPPAGDAELDDLWEEAEAASAPRLAPWLRVVIGLVVLVGAFVGSGFLPAGNGLALATGIGLAIFGASLGVVLVPGPGLARSARVLALVRPRRSWLWFPVALVAGVLLWVTAIEATQLVPSTGESAIQTFVSWPSGLLSFACLAVVAPLAEEVFVRGFVYGLLAEKGRALAFAGASLLFVIAHVPQTSGQWGALVAILVTGLGLTTLRAASRSTLVPALAHLVYNGLLAIMAVL